MTDSMDPTRGRGAAGPIAALLALSLLAASARPAAGAEAAAPPEQGAEARLAALGIELPELPPPIANYVRAVRTGNLVFLAGHGPLRPEGGYVTGKVGRDLTVEQGYEAARLTAIALLASLKEEIGDLDRVERIVKVLGMVNAEPGFTEQPQVINGCSDLLVEIFGERGRHARAAVGMASLPVGIAVEIEMVVEVRESPAGAEEASFVRLAEGYTTDLDGRGIVAGQRMFTVPDLPDICAASPRPEGLVVRDEPVLLRVGEWFPLARLDIVGVDAAGAPLPASPIELEVEAMDPPSLELRSDLTADGRVLPIRSGSFRFRASTICPETLAAIVFRATVR